MSRRLFACLLFAAGCKTSPSGQDVPPARPTEIQPATGHQMLLSDGPFEGEITLRLSTGNEHGEAIYRVKDTRIRMDLPGDAGAGAIVFNGATNTGVILSRDGSVLSPISSASIRSKTPPVILRSGTSDVVLGHTCERWSMREGEITREACVVDNVAWASEATQFAGWLPKGAFPLRVIERDAKGAETSRLEITKIERKVIPAAIFETSAPHK